MNVERALTDFSQSRYNNRMEGNVGLLENRRKEELKQEFQPHAPKGSELQQELERRLESLDPTEGQPKAPEFVLRKEENWEDFGWTKKDKEEVLTQLKRLFGFNDDYAQNALENIVAANNSPEKAKQMITKDTFDQFLGHFKKPEPQEQLAAEARGETPLQELPDEEASKRAKLALLRSMRIDEEYAKRFILTNEFKEENKHEYDEKMPDNLYELAWNLTVFDQENFGINGKFPILQLQIEHKKDKEGKIEKDVNGKPIINGQYVVNEANFMRWIRKQINTWYDIDGEDEVTNYFEKIVVSKNQYTSVPLGNMLYNYTRFFTDETGQMHNNLYMQVLMEPLMLMNLRGYDLEYKSVMGDEEKLAETITKSFYSNKMTRKTFQKSLLYYLTTLGVDFDGKDSDSKMGEAWNKIYLAYYNLGDFKELQKVLGKDSAFFTKKGMEKAILTVYERKHEMTGLPLLGKVLGEKEKDFNAAFDASGNVTEDTKDAFISFINFFVKPTSDSDAIDIVREALRNSVRDLLVSKEGNSERFKKDESTIDRKVYDEHTLGVAELVAFSWLRISGAAAKNDTGAAGFDAQSKWLRTEAYRRKMATDERGGGFGNPYTVAMFKEVLVDVFRGTNVVNAAKYNKDGKEIRKLTPLEVMMNMQKTTEKYEKLRKDKQEDLRTATGAREEKIRRELADLEELEKIDYKIVAGQLEFGENALKQYALDHVNRARHIYNQIMTAHEIDFDKFTVYDSAVRGVSFKRSEFQAAVQKDFLTHLRYLLASYDKLNMNMDVRSQVFKGRKVGKDGKAKDVWEWQTMPLGQAIFGHQILDIPQFRKEAKKITEEDRKKGYTKKGKYIKDKEGKYVIDYDEVQKNKTLAWKQWALMKFAADMWTHIDRHSTDPAYGLSHYIDIIEALEKIPGEVFGDETNMRGGRIIQTFFSHEQIKWLRKMSGTTPFKLYTRAILSDIFQSKHSKEGLFNESTNTFIGAIFKGI